MSVREHDHVHIIEHRENKASAYEILKIDSRDRTLLTDSTHNFKINLRSKYQKVSNIELLNLQLPNTHFNVDSGNNQIHFDEGGGPLIGIVTPGAYTTTTILSVIKTAMEAVGGNTYTITYSNIIFRFTIASTGPYLFLWGTTTSTMSKLLGFLNVNTTPLSPSITSTNAIDLTNGSDYIFIVIPEFGITSRSSGRDNVDHATWMIPNSSNTSEIIAFNSLQFHSISFLESPKNISKLGISLKKTGNEDFDIQNSDWSMLLRLTM